MLLRRIIIVLICAFFFVPGIAFAGNIDSTEKYAWGENIGWVNFGTSSGDVTVTDGAMTGYAWSSNYGWIDLGPASSGVLNDGSGNLSGYAWGENIGWIDFSGVTINTSTGEFSGYATNTFSGDISFNCSNTSSCGSSDFKVTTSWSPSGASSTSVGSSTGTVSNSDIELNDGTSSVSDRYVIIVMEATGATEYLISEDPNFTYDSWKPFVADNDAPVKYGDDGSLVQTMTVLFELSEGEGEKTIYVRFRSRSGNVSSTYSDIVMYEKEITIEDPEDPDIVDIFNEGDFVRTTDHSTVYVIENGYRRPIIDEQTYFTYKHTWDDLIWTYVEYLDNYALGNPILPKPETVLVKIQSWPRVYQVVDIGDGKTGIRWIEDEDIAKEMYGLYWSEYVIDINPAYFVYFKELTSIKEVEPISRTLLRSRAILNGH